MTTKEYLWQIKDMKRRVAEKQSEIDSMRNMLTSISVRTDDERVQSSSDPDKIGSMISDILDRESELKTLVEAFLRKEKEISEQIDSMENSRQREILHWRYIECLPLEKVAVNYMEISFRHATRIHGQALIEFDKKFGKNYK